MTEIYYFCEQCVKEGCVSDKSKGDKEWGMKREVMKLYFIHTDTHYVLSCGHVYRKSHHYLKSHATVELVKTQKKD